MAICCRIMELPDQEPDQFGMQIVVQLVQHDDVAPGQGVNPGPRQCEHLPRTLRLLGNVKIGWLPAVGLMLQEDVHCRAVGAFSSIGRGTSFLDSDVGYRKIGCSQKVNDV